MDQELSVRTSRRESKKMQPLSEFCFEHGGGYGALWRGITRGKVEAERRGARIWVNVRSARAYLRGIQTARPLRTPPAA